MVVRLCADFEEYLDSRLAIRIFLTLNIFYRRSWKDKDTLAKLNYDTIDDIDFLRCHVTRNAIFILIGNLAASNLESSISSEVGIYVDRDSVVAGLRPE